MRMPWSENPKREDIKKECNADVLVLAHEEVEKSKQRVSRIDKILLEARQAESVVKKARAR